MLKDTDLYNFLEICLTNMENNYWILLQKQKLMLPKSNPQSSCSNR